MDVEWPADDVRPDRDDPTPGPPREAESDHEAVPDEDVNPDPPAGPDPLRFSRWMRQSATGAVLSGIALGLQQALEPKRPVAAFVIAAPGEPEDPDAMIRLHFDPDDPTKTVAVIRRQSAAPPDNDPPASEG